jgi:serine protease inhibitor
MKNTKTKRKSLSPAVRAANALTAQWCTRLGSGDFALSGAGLWPLLALLASAADEQARAELTNALGRPADSGQQDALELIEILRGGVSTAAALGVWTREGIPLDDRWAAGLPEGVVHALTDQAALDRWASEQTDGLIETFPLEVTPEIVLILASALAARVKWRTPFDASPRGKCVSWDDPGEPDQQWLSRTTSDLAEAAVLDGAVTRIVVEGDGDVDVHLLLGEQQPVEVLAAGLRELAGEAEVRSAAESAGPGLTVRRIPSSSRRDMLELTLPSFEITTRHNLMEHADLFGLRLVAHPGTSHLPHLSPVPLFVSDGVQDVLARFFAEGFEAAAVTAFGMTLGGMPPDEPYEVTFVEATFDRPFGFIAVHRPSRLAVVAGWVSSPFEAGQS